MAESDIEAPIKQAFPFLALPSEIRQAIYTYTLSTTLSITDPRLSRAPTLEEMAFLASRRGTWNLCLTCRLVYAESLALRWENLTVALSRDGTRSVGAGDGEDDDGRHRLGNADHALRRRIRRLIVDDPRCFGACYGLKHLGALRSLTLRVERRDGLLLEHKLMADVDVGAEDRARGRRLGVHVHVVPDPPVEVGMFTSATTTGPAVQKQWRRDAVARGKRARYLWLSDTMPFLPEGCDVRIHAEVVMATWEVLRGLDGFRVEQGGRDRWTLTYDEEI